MRPAGPFQPGSLAPDRQLATDTPVICIIYNRARLARKVVDRLRQIKPGRILIVADGPKPGNGEDVQACAQARAEFERIDWDCSIDRDYAESNLGCRRRILSGLDWAFGLVDQAIILEDDIDAHPFFFSWAGRLLSMYAERDDVAMLSGHNPLVRWPSVAPFTAGIPSRRGGIYGWATWRHKWQAVQKTCIGGSASMAAGDVAACCFEPVLGALYTFYLEQARKVPCLSWDVDWSLRMAMSGRISIVSPVNLVHNLGLGPDATITKDGDDMLFFLPRPTGQDSIANECLLGPAPLRQLPAGDEDRVFDRARVLIELLVRTRDPAMARRLARRDELPLDGGMRLHLLPFRHGGETRGWIEHLAGEGVDAAAIQRWRRALADGNEPPVVGMSR